MKTVSFKCSGMERGLITRIAERAYVLAKKNSIQYSKIEASMDVTACHVNHQALALDRLLSADDFNFAHDVFGIRRHLDRKTGALLDCFVPRCSALPAFNSR